MSIKQAYAKTVEVQSLHRQIFQVDISALTRNKSSLIRNKEHDADLVPILS